MRSLTEIRKKKEIRQNSDMQKQQQYGNPSTISMIAKIIKMQNMMLLSWISKKKKLSKDDEIELFKKFLNVNYYCPDIISEEKFLKMYL